MKISRNWLQNYFKDSLPDANALADALTFHAFEIDGVEQHRDDYILDVKVTPNRGHDCLSHRGVAQEISAILEKPLNAAVDPFAKQPDFSKKSEVVTVTIDQADLCKRYIAAHVRGVKVGPSPDWLRNSLESVGQRSINNVVDATNLVMFNVGQPLHAFDAGKLAQSGGTYAIMVRKAGNGEVITALDGKEYALTDAMLVIADSSAAIGIAGVKGGMPAGVDESTTDIIIESANFDGVSVRKTSAALKLRTDASSRFEQVLSPELAAYGMQQAVDMIVAIAGGTVEGFVDEYPMKQKIEQVSVSVAKVNSVLGTQIPKDDMERALTRLGLSHSVQGDTFTITPRFERLDLVIPEDVIEEIGRIVGYDKVPQTELAQIGVTPAVLPNFARMESAREHMSAEGYSEVYTSVFAEKGEREVLNKVGGERSKLRANLVDGLRDALERNVRNKDLLGLQKVKLFEIGTVWRNGGEEMLVGTAEEKGEVKEYNLSELLAAEAYPTGDSSRLERYKSFSRYPFVVRDIAMWVPAGTEPESVIELIRGDEGELLVRLALFDTFTKGDRTSLAFRLVFQSMEKTLTDEEVSAVMERIHATLRERGFEIR